MQIHLGLSFFNFIFFSLLFIRTTSCYCEDLEYWKYVDKVVASTITEIEKKDGLKLFGYGGGMMHDLYLLSTHFTVQKPLTMDEARKMYISGTKGLLKAINTDCNIRPYLHDFPFTDRNLQFFISYTGENPIYKSPPYVKVLYETKGKIFYKSINPTTGDLFTLYSEPYEDALKLILGSL